MKAWSARAIAYAAVALLAFVALNSVPQVEERPRLAQVLPPVWREREDTVGPGETLTALLARGGLVGRAAAEALGAADSLDTRRIPAGMRVTLGSRTGDTVPSAITLHLNAERRLHLTRTDSGWVGRDELVPWVTDTIVLRGHIRSNLYDALDSAGQALPTGARTEVAWDIADIFEYRLDMSRDVQEGDAFSVLFERKRGPDGAQRVGNVLAATFTNAGKTMQAFRHERSGQRARYYDAAGKSMEAAFLRAPLQFRRISSVFGLRKHPILGVWRAHRGTDYAASSGTPVRAIGDGVVAFAGRKGGYGNTLEIRHTNGFVSRYGHLKSFAKGVRGGRRVGIGETVAYVGQTGLASGPHLHFEVLVRGVQQNPRSALAGKEGVALPNEERPRFEGAKALYVALLGALPEGAATAVGGSPAPPGATARH